jgi:hypothetical protein
MNLREHTYPDPAIRPLMGLISVVLSTIAAVVLVGSDYAVPGGLFQPAFVMTVGLLLAPAVAAYRSPASIFRVEHLIMVGLVYWLLMDLLQGAYPLNDVNRAAVENALTAIGVFAAGVWIANLHSAWKLPTFVARAAAVEISATLLFRAVLTSAALCLLRFALPCNFNPWLMVTSLFGSRWSAPWGRGAMGGWDAFLDHLSYFGYLLPTLTVLLAHRLGNWRQSRVIFSLLLSLVCAAFIAQGGGRRIIGVMFGSALICWGLLQGTRIRRRHLAVVAAIGAMVLIVMQLMLQYRGIGFGKLLENDGPQSLEYLHVDDNFLRLAQVIQIVPSEHPYTYEKLFVWAAIRPIPRVLWPGKPLDPGINLADAVGAKGVSLTCSIVGEFYFGFGWIGLFVGGWSYGRLGGVCNQLLTASTSPVRLLMYAVGAMAVIAGLRSIIELVLMSYVLLAWLAISAFLRPAAAPQVPSDARSWSHPSPY